MPIATRFGLWPKCLRTLARHFQTSFLFFVFFPYLLDIQYYHTEGLWRVRTISHLLWNSNQAVMTISSTQPPPNPECRIGDAATSWSTTILPISEDQDDPAIRARYRPFLRHYPDGPKDWIDGLELDRVTRIAQTDLEKTGSRIKVLVLYGSLRKRYVHANGGVV